MKGDIGFEKIKTLLGVYRDLVFSFHLKSNVVAFTSSYLSSIYRVHKAGGHDSLRMMSGTRCKMADGLHVLS